MGISKSKKKELPEYIELADTPGVVQAVDEPSLVEEYVRLSEQVEELRRENATLKATLKGMGRL